MIRVAVVDDHFVVRIGLKAIIDMQSDMVFAGEKENASGILDFLAEAKPDVVLLDIRMPGEDGLSALKEIVDAKSNVKTIMLTTSDADNDIYTALESGAKGYLLKDRDSKAIAQAIRTVAEGGKFIPSAVRELYQERQMMDELTPREKEVLALMVEGLSNKEIAARFGVAHDTVKFQTKRIFDKLGVSGRVNAVTEAIRRGLVRS
ncbi:MAG: response regulator transcription factor [Kiritimatiellae bacterium]|nr:response regulator transcription factor [Kiritimatiellia bacterium]